MIGQKVAQTLEIPFYDNQLMDLIAKESGLAHETVQDLAERAPGSFLYNIYTTRPPNFLWQTKCFSPRAKSSGILPKTSAASLSAQPATTFFGNIPER